MIRPMTYKDIEIIQEIDCQCFKSNFKRRKEALKAYMDINNNASLVYEEDGRVAGYIFNHIWGNFAWFGPLGVDSAFRGKGIGKELVNSTIELFKNDYGIENIGMGTMPDSPYNIGFYSRLGFKPINLTAVMRKELKDTSIAINKGYELEFFNLNNAEGYNKLFMEVRDISERVSEGLDLSSLVLLIKEGLKGEIILLKEEDKTIGFAVCQVQNIREMESNTLEIRLLCLSGAKDYMEALDSLLESCYVYGYNQGLREVEINCYTGNYEAYRHLVINQKFNITRTFACMMMGDESYLVNYNGIILCRWAG